MTYKEFSEVNATAGVHTMFQYVAEIEEIFFPLTLFVIFMIVALGSYFAQKEMTGRGNAKGSFAVAGFVTTAVAYVLSLIPGVVNTLTVVVCLAVSIAFTLLLFLPRKR